MHGWLSVVSFSLSITRRPYIFLLTPEAPARMSRLAHAVRELCLHLPDAVGWSSWTAAERGEVREFIKAREAARLPDDAGGFRVCGEVVT